MPRAHWPGACLKCKAYFSRIATTPWPPAAQMEMSARPEPLSSSSLAALATMRAPVAANGWAAASDDPLTLSFDRSTEPSGASRPSFSLQNAGSLPSGQRREHLTGKGLVDLVEVEVLQRQAVALQHARDGVCRRHEQALGATDVVDGGNFVVDEVRLHLPAALLGFLLGRQQHRRCTVGQRRRVAGRHRGFVAEALAEDRLELGERLDSGVGAQVGVLLDAAERGHKVVLPARIPGRSEVLMRLGGELVLRLAGDAPIAGGDRLMFTHRQSGARLGVLRLVRSEHGRANLRDQREHLLPVALGAGLVEVDEDLAQLVVDGERRVRRGVGAASDAEPRTCRARSCSRRARPPRGQCRTPAGCRRRWSLGASLEPSTTSRARLKSRACLRTAPATNSPTISFSSPKRSTRPSSAAVSISWFETPA